MFPTAVTSSVANALAWVTLLLCAIHPVSSEDCNGRNGGVYIPINEPCHVTFYTSIAGNEETQEDHKCVFRNQDYVELTAKDVSVWPDMCLEKDPLRCYSVEEYRELLSFWAGADDEDFEFAVPTEATHMMVNCTADAEGGVAISSETIAMSAGVIAAIVIGVLVCICLFVGLLCCCCC
uniref:Uncharacterized protein n=1 Tax=Pseudictyota dubia TaxID=2749911 RepID=A0A7R9W6D3_9STRA|mmetsp:Transcript_36280/g.67006  ORF Transcript_36280/g.67006 Transcript_36280/m.67006 type:complete len:179 (+) Transcript_36280:121-657(+)